MLDGFAALAASFFLSPQHRLRKRGNSTAVEQARGAFARKWKLRCQAVYQSFEEAGDQLFTFTAFPILAMEGAAHHQRAGANQRGVPEADQNPGLVAERGGSSAAALRPPAQRSSAAAPSGRLARTRFQ